MLCDVKKQLKKSHPSEYGTNKSEYANKTHEHLKRQNKINSEFLKVKTLTSNLFLNTKNNRLGEGEKTNESNPTQIAKQPVFIPRANAQQTGAVHYLVSENFSASLYHRSREAQRPVRPASAKKIWPNEASGVVEDEQSMKDVPFSRDSTANAKTSQLLEQWKEIGCPPLEKGKGYFRFTAPPDEAVKGVNAPPKETHERSVDEYIDSIDTSQAPSSKDIRKTEKESYEEFLERLERAKTEKDGFETDEIASEDESDQDKAYEVYM